MLCRLQTLGDHPDGCVGEDFRLEVIEHKEKAERPGWYLNAGPLVFKANTPSLNYVLHPTQTKE